MPLEGAGIAKAQKINAGCPTYPINLPRGERCCHYCSRGRTQTELFSGAAGCGVVIQIDTVPLMAQTVYLTHTTSPTPKRAEICLQ